MSNKAKQPFRLQFFAHDPGDAVRGAKPEGVFTRDADGEELVDTIRDAVESGRMSVRDAIDEAVRIAPAAPDNLEVYTFLGAQLWDLGRRDEAGNIYIPQYERVSALIPKGYKGTIDWLHHDNRPFLRLAHGTLLSHMHRGDGRAAMSLARKLLRWSPSDNLGVRFLVGDIAMLSGDDDRALREYIKTANHRPVEWYKAALVALRRTDFVAACTYLRRGIFENPYVAEALTGRTILQEHLYWHGSNIYEPEFALHYIDGPACDWSDEEVDFVDWVFNSSHVLHERATATAFREQLTYLHDYDVRGAVVQKRYDHFASITDEISTLMVTKVKNRWDEDVWPWDRQAMKHPASVRQASQ